MCGICGFVSLTGAPVPHERVLRQMNATIRRRGPDGEGYLTRAPVGLAMRRLAIVDLDGGQQPISNEDGAISVVFNGEIYNYRELRTLLQQRGHRLATHSDTEVLVHLYEDHGLEFLKQVRGMFALALWDSRTQRLVLARDRFGIKPLYWTRAGDTVYFGSELKTLAAAGVLTRELDWDAIDRYLTYGFIPAPLTIYRDVRKLEPATLMTVEAPTGQIATRRYWGLPAPGQTRAHEPQDWLAAVETALTDAVRSHMVADVPVGAFLSGGVDSGLVVAMMAQCASTPPKAFTVGFSDTGGGFIDERPYARLLAARYAVEHHEIEVSPQVSAILPEIVTAFDEPFADDSVIPSYYVCQAAAAHVKVVQSGLGGDELFGGYKRHLGIRLASAYGMLPQTLRRHVIGPAVRRIPEGLVAGDAVDHLKRFVASRGHGTAGHYQSYMATLPEEQRRLLYSDARLPADFAATARVITQPFQASGDRDPVQSALRTDLAVYLPDDVLTLTDRLSMWHSLEVRVPFLDHPLVELVANMPAKLKVGMRRQKVLLRRLAYRWLPRQMIEHRKQGFEAPMAAWLRGPLRPMVEDLLLDSTLLFNGCLNQQYVRGLVQEHLSGTRKHSKILFYILMLEMWARAAKPA